MSFYYNLSDLYLGQLKVNLRPVWGSTADAVANLAQRFPDVVWENTFSELKTIDEQNSYFAMPPWSKNASREEEIKETERSWRDPSFYKLRKIINQWMDDTECERSIIEVSTSHIRYMQFT